MFNGHTGIAQLLGAFSIHFQTLKRTSCCGTNFNDPVQIFNLCQHVFRSEFTYDVLGTGAKWS